MGKNRANQKHKTTPVPQRNKKDVIYTGAVLIAVCALIFYPPYVRGLFFPEDMYLYHILTAIVLLLVWIDKISRKEYSFIQTPLDWAVLAYAGAYLLSLTGAIHIGEAFYGFLKALNYFMVYWVVTQMVRNYRDYVNVLRILVTSGTGVALIGILAATGYSQYPAAFEPGRILSTLQYPNTTAAYLAVMTLIAVTLWIREENRFIKLLYALAAFLMMLVVLAALSKGAWVIFVLGALLFLIGMPGLYRIKSIYILGLSGGAALITAVKFLPAITGPANPRALPFILLGMAIVFLGEVIWEGVSWAYRRWGNLATSVGLVIILLIILSSGVSMVAKAQILGQELKNTALLPRLTALKDIGGSSYSSRMDFNHWAVDIIKDHPLTGTGAGGWNAYYHSYQDYQVWTTEVHNHFLQVGVETGIIGMAAFLSMWLVMLVLFYKRYKRTYRPNDDKNQLENDQGALNWGIASAAIAFGAHAAIDFDLSLGAMCILLWTLFALLNAGGRIDNLYQMKSLEKPWIPVTCGVLLIIFMGVCGQRLVMAQNLDKAGKALWTETLPLSDNTKKASQLQTLTRIYEQAAGLDPLNSSYAANAAQAGAMHYVILKSQQVPQEDQALNISRVAISHSEKLSPRDVKNISLLVNASNLIGDYDGMARQARRLVEINPNDIHAYEAALQTSLMAAEYNMHNNHSAPAVNHLQAILVLADQLEKQKAAINSERPWSGAPLRLSPDNYLTLCKAHYILGNYKTALDILEPLISAGTPPAAPETQAWHRACLYRNGHTTAAEAGINSLQSTAPDTVALYKQLITLEPLK